MPTLMRSKLGWWPPLPLFSLSFSWKEGGGLGWLPHPPFCPLTTDPMVERAERQTFAPKVAGSSPTGTLCERRGEKTLSGLFCPCRPQPDGEAPLSNQKEGGQKVVATGHHPRAHGHWHLHGAPRPARAKKIKRNMDARGWPSAQLPTKKKHGQEGAPPT